MIPRGRPKKYRIVRFAPKTSQFSPRGKPGRPDEANLATDEYEAIRLADHMGLSQKEASKSMHISQQTFSRILRRAHKTLAEAVVGGKTLKIQGGVYAVTSKDEVLQKDSDKTSLNKPQS